MQLATKMLAVAVVWTSSLVASQAAAATRVFYENFDDPTSVDTDLWIGSNNCAKAIVDASDGAVVHQGGCLRGNWKDAFTDPITKLTTASSGYARYSGFDIQVSSEITDEMYLDYWAFVDEDAAKAYGCKWIWLEGTYKPSPSVYDQKFNHIVQPPWQGWDTWRIISNNTNVGEGGGQGDRKVDISSLPGIQALMGSESVDEWFDGRWHHFQLHMKLNTPASASNGIFRFWIDGVLVFDITNYKYRDHDQDLISHFSTPHMYGGGDPPPGSFGWQLDELQVFDGVPEPVPGSGGAAGAAGSAAGGSSGAGTGGGAAGASAGGWSGQSGSGGGSGGGGGSSASGGASNGGDAGGDDGGCHVSRASGAGVPLWLWLALLVLAGRRRLTTSS